MNVWLVPLVRFGIVDMVCVNGNIFMSSAVVMRVMVDESYRSRLKLLSVAMGVSMGDLVQRISQSEETLDQLEQQFMIGKKDKNETA